MGLGFRVFGWALGCEVVGIQRAGLWISGLRFVN